MNKESTQKQPRYTQVTSQTSKKGVLKRPPSFHTNTLPPTPLTSPHLPSPPLPFVCPPDEMKGEKSKKTPVANHSRGYRSPRHGQKHLAMHSRLEDFICPKLTRFRNAEATTKKELHKIFLLWCVCVCV